MSERQEFYAATVEEAVEKASAVLGASQEELDFEVLDAGSTGFLGIGARDARIAVGLAGLPLVDLQEAANGEDRTPEFSTESGDEPRYEERPPTAQEQPAETIAEAVEEDAGSGDAEEVPQEVILAVDEFMTSLIDAMGLDATVDAYDAGDMIAVDVATEQTGLFIGQKGETIDAVQFLLNVVVYRDRPFVKRIVVDSEGYRRRRVEAIQGMAHRTARRALREKRPLSLPPMSAAERRVVHLFLKENPGVTTSSEGEEEGRRVVVSPI